MVVRKVKKGARFESRTGAGYQVLEVKPNGGLTVARDGGKPFNVSGKLIAWAADEAAKGRRFEAQANKPDGGISYTVGITVAVAWAAGLSFDGTTYGEK